MIMDRIRKNRSVRGFTLLELLIALSLLAIGLLAAAAMHSVAMHANSHADRISVATMLGQQVMEDLGAFKNSDPLLNTSVIDATYDRMFDPGANAATAGTAAIPGAGTFSARYDIAPNTPMTGTTQITVRVFFNGSTTPVVTFSTCKMVT